VCWSFGVPGWGGIHVAGSSLPQAEVCHTATTPTSHTKTPTHIETRTHNQCSDTIEKSHLLMMDVLMSETC